MSAKPRPMLAPRRAPSDVDVEAFITGGAPPVPPPSPVPSDASSAVEPRAAPPAHAATAPEPPKEQPTEKATGRAVVQRKDGREFRRKTLYLPPDLAVRLDVYAARTQRDQSEITAEALAGWLDSKGA